MVCEDLDLEKVEPVVTNSNPTLYQLILTVNYSREYDNTCLHHRHMPYDTSIIVVDTCNNYRIVDRGTLHAPLFRAYPMNRYRCQCMKYMKSYTLGGVDRILADKLKRFSIHLVWVYGDNRILRSFKALVDADHIQVLNLQKAYINNEISISLNLREPYEIPPKYRDVEVQNIPTSQRITKIVLLLAYYFIAGYDWTDHKMNLPEHHVNPEPCDAHQFIRHNDIYLCAATLALTNRFILLMLRRLQVLYLQLHQKQPNRERVEKILEMNMRGLMIKMLYPDRIKWQCKPTPLSSPDKDFSYSVSDIQMTILTNDNLEDIVDTFHQRVNRLKHPIDHSDSDMMENVITFLGYSPSMYPTLLDIP